MPDRERKSFLPSTGPVVWQILETGDLGEANTQEVSIISGKGIMIFFLIMPLRGFYLYLIPNANCDVFSNVFLILQ